MEKKISIIGGGACWIGSCVYYCKGWSIKDDLYSEALLKFSLAHSNENLAEVFVLILLNLIY